MNGADQDLARARTNGSEPSADADSAPAAPPVVAVVVAHAPGPWFGECLASLAAQDYPALDILVVDTGATPDLAAQVAAILPTAYVRRAEDATAGGSAGYGAAANEVLGVVEGAAFYLLCHDDVALAPDAASVLVEEAYRSNGGVVGPKLVHWDDPQHLLSVGLAVDKTGVPAPLAERGELDQEQHDAVRDVFAVAGGCVLVRADLFSAIGGFDTGIDFLGDDVDLCWRAQVAGARVLVAPAAVVRHVEALGARRPHDDRRRLQCRHRLRTMLGCYGPFHLLRVLPQAILLALAEIMYSVFAGRFGEARDVALAWPWNVARIGQIAANRRRLRAVRQVPDHEVRRLQVHGSARIAAFARGQLGHGDDRLRSVTAAGPRFVGSIRQEGRRAPIITWFVVVVALLVGSRSLITTGIPAIGDYPTFHHSPARLLSEWLSGWRSAGLGSESPAPTAFAFLALAGSVLAGAMALLRTLLVVGLLPVGAAGAWRLLRGAGSRPRLAVLVGYLAIPVPYNAIAQGHWGGLVVWAAMPFLVARLGRATGLAPFAPARDAESPPASIVGSFASRPAAGALLADVAGLALLTAVVAAFVPSAVLLVLVVAVGLAAGSVLSGERGGLGRMLLVAAGGAAGAAILHVPWTLDWLRPGSEWAAFAAPRGAASGSGFGALLRFETGPIGAAPLGWAYLAAATLPLIIGRSWRLTWAVRGWTLAITCWVLLWFAWRGDLGIGLPTAETVLAPAALGMAMAIGLGLAAFDRDLTGYHFGYRQLALLLAAVGGVAAVLPIAGLAFEGRWKAPSAGFESALDFLDAEHAAAGPYRVLWIGDPAVLPLSGWQLDEDTAYATSDEGTPTVEDRWAGSSDGPTELVADAIQIAERRETSRLGRLLAPMAIRYIVVPETADPFDDGPGVAPAAVLDALTEQLDLVPIEVPLGVHVYRNEAWAPTPAVLPSGAAGAGDDYFAVAAVTDLSGADVALPDEPGYQRAEGDLEAGTDMYLAAQSSPRWRLSLDGHAAPRRTAFGWANAFAIEDGGAATLRYRTSPVRWVLLVVQVMLWFWAVHFLRVGRRWEAEGAPETPPAEASAAVVPPPARELVDAAP